MKLSCVEALAATMYIVGLKEDAANILAKFKWGQTFIDLNRELLDDYAASENGEGVIKVQNEYIQSCENEVREKQERKLLGQFDADDEHNYDGNSDEEEESDDDELSDNDDEEKHDDNHNDHQQDQHDDDKDEHDEEKHDQQDQHDDDEEKHDDDNNEESNDNQR
jgi:pre-rRNA-processing protein TSR3